MDSTNYSIPKDVTSQTGGSSASASYKILHNVGEQITGQISSTTYKIDQGFIHSDLDVLLFTISASAINFGVLTTSSVSTDSITLTTSTSAVSANMSKLMTILLLELPTV